MALIELVEGFFVRPEDVVVVKATGDGGCALFTVGQSAVDGGFRLPFSAAEVAEELNDAEEAGFEREDEYEEGKGAEAGAK